MKKYTVVLLRPDYLASDDQGGFGQDVYAAHVETISSASALAKAQGEAADAAYVDASDGPEQSPSPEDYALVVMFDGHHEPTMFGWQL